MAARLSLTLTESDVNVANNTSKVTAKLYYYGNGVSYNNNNPSGTIKIDGTSYSFNSNFGTSTSAQLLATKSKTVTHNADGAKTVSVSASFKTGVSLGTLSTSKSITLTTIPRASQPSVNKASLVINGSDSDRTVTINTNRASSSFTHTLECKIGNTVIATFSGVGASYNWKVPMGTLGYITNKTSETITITCKTYNGSTLLGTKTTTLVATTPSIPPTIGTITMAQGVTMPSGITAYVQGKSKLSLTIPVTLAYSSPVAKIEVTIGGVTYVANSPSGTGSYVVVTDYLSMSGNNLPITVKVTDGRGNSSTNTSKTITILSYTPATVSNVSYQHMSDTVTRLHVQGYVTDLAGSNSSPTIKVYFKKVSETSYPSANVVSTTVGTGSISKNIDVTVQDTNIAYEYKIVITDKFGNSNEYILKTGIVVLSRKAGGTGVTLFEEATEDGFVVGGGKSSKIPTTHATVAASKILTQDSNGWLQNRTPTELRSDMDIDRLLTAMFGTAYDLNVTVTKYTNWTTVSASVFLVGSTIRIYVSGTRSSATGAGNITNEKICRITMTHNGKLKDMYNTTGVNRDTGPVSTYYTSNGEHVDANRFAFDVNITANHSEVTSFNSYMVAPVLVDWTKY